MDYGFIKSDAFSTAVVCLEQMMANSLVTLNAPLDLTLPGAIEELPVSLKPYVLVFRDEVPTLYGPNMQTDPKLLETFNEELTPILSDSYFISDSIFFSENLSVFHNEIFGSGGNSMYFKLLGSKRRRRCGTMHTDPGLFYNWASRRDFTLTDLSLGTVIEDVFGNYDDYAAYMLSYRQEYDNLTYVDEDDKISTITEFLKKSLQDLSEEV